jgi:prolyl oligopeptidase
MAARTKCIGSCPYEAYLYETAAGGHGLARNNERAAFTSLGYAFLKNKIGWSDRPV